MLQKLRRANSFKSMTLLGHIAEFRSVLLISGLAILLCSVIGWIFFDQIFAALREPIRTLLSRKRIATLNFPVLSAAFELRIQVAFTIGVILASPVWLHQLFYFFLPALKRTERIIAILFVAVNVPLFLFGAFLAWRLFPNIVQIATEFASPEDTLIMDARLYYAFALKLLLVIGAAFVIPSFLVFLNILRVVSAKAIMKMWRVIVLVVIVFSAAVTPASDVVSMFLLAAPVIFLYGFACLICFGYEKIRDSLS